MVFRVGESKEALSSARAAVYMVRGDLIGGDPRMTPLFRHPEKGGEISKRFFGRWWKEALIRVGLRELATGGH